MRASAHDARTRAAIRRVASLGAAGLLFTCAGRAAADGGAQERGGARGGIVRLDDGTMNIGAAHLDPGRGTLEVPGAVNMDQGMIEVLACAPWGKTHESLFVLDVEPYLIQVGLLLLLDLPPDARSDAQTDTPITEYVPTGPPLRLSVSWQDSTRATRESPVEDLVCRDSVGTTMEDGSWLFTGSYVIDAGFAAQLTGTVVATYLDPAAMVNNARTDANNDDAYRICASGVPPRGTPVVLRFSRQ